MLVMKMVEGFVLVAGVCFQEQSQLVTFLSKWKEKELVENSKNLLKKNELTF